MMEDIPLPKQSAFTGKGLAIGIELAYLIRVGTIVTALECGKLMRITFICHT